VWEDPPVEIRYRAGDVLRLSCPPQETHVTSMSRFHFAVRSPWNEPDPESEFRWNGDLAFRNDSAHLEWRGQPYRTDPEPDELSAGSPCVIGIPPTVAYVLYVAKYAEPRDVGHLPRPRAHLAMVMHGETEDPDWEDQGFGIDPDDPDIEIALLHRPYSWLETGDEVADAREQGWRFFSPWIWEPVGAETTATAPTWPLKLVSRGGDPLPGDAARVAGATATGSHRDEQARWTTFTGAEPPPTYSSDASAPSAG
jgi:hypothetical protein